MLCEAARKLRGSCSELYCLVDPLLVGLRPASDLVLLEPELDLILRAVGSIASVDDVAADLNAQVTADASGQRVVGVGGSDQLAAALDDVLALPDHADNGSAGKVLAQATVERLGAEVKVVSLGLLKSRVQQLDSDQLVATRLEAADDLSDQCSLHTIGLDGNEGALVVGTGLAVVRTASA